MMLADRIRAWRYHRRNAKFMKRVGPKIRAHVEARQRCPAVMANGPQCVHTEGHNGLHRAFVRFGDES